MILQAAINGARRAGDHPALPVTPEGIIEAARESVLAGANEIHLHLRDGEGRETLQPAAVDPLLRGFRKCLPGTLCGVSTGLWIEGQHGLTAAAIHGWHWRPDYASVNIREAGHMAVAEALLARGIGIELGLFDEGDVETALRAGLVERSFRVLIEVIEPEPEAACAVAGRMLDRLHAAQCTRPVLLHGMEATTWPLFDMAVARHLSQRLGLEDGLTLPDGTQARDNAAIIAAAIQRRAAAC